MDTSPTHTHVVTAAEEYQRNPELQPEDIEHLREWVASQKHLPPVTEEILILIHHSCYYDLERSKKCIENYYTMRSHMPEFFTQRDVTSPELSRSLQTLNLAPLPVQHPKTGYQFMYHGLKSSDPSKYVFVDAVKLSMMMFDVFALEHGTTSGFSVIFDMEGTKLGHLIRVSISALRKYSVYVQEANPVRLKAIHMVNANFLVDKAIVLAKPFLKKELYEAIHIHKPGTETLYEHIPRECLPAEFGGTLESKEIYCDANTKSLRLRVDYFKADELSRVNEALREKKKKNKEPATPDTNMPKDTKHSPTV